MERPSPDATPDAVTQNRPGDRFAIHQADDQRTTDARSFRAAALAGELHLIDFSDWDEWDLGKLQYRDEAEVSWLMRAGAGERRIVRTAAELDAARRASLFEFGDCVTEYIARHANGDAGSATVVRTLCRGIASGSRLRSGFLYNLVRVARAFPPEQRDEYADGRGG